MRVIAGDVSIVTRKSVRPNGDKLGNDAWNIPRNHPHHPQPVSMGAMMGIDTVMDRMLDDWGWWVRDRSGSGYRCRSVEGRYRPERVPGDDERSARRMVDERVCVAVERTICHPAFPKEARIILAGWYVRRDAPGFIAAKAGIPRSWFQDRLVWAVLVARNRLRVGEFEKTC